MSSLDELEGFKVNTRKELVMVCRVKSSGAYFVVNISRANRDYSDVMEKSRKPRSRPKPALPDGLVDPRVCTHPGLPYSRCQYNMPS